MVGKIDTEAISQEGKTGNLDAGVLGEGLSGGGGGGTIMVLKWERSEMVVNSCLEVLEGRMRLKKMWKLGPHEGKEEEQMNGGEQ